MPSVVNLLIDIGNSSVKASFAQGVNLEDVVRYEGIDILNFIMELTKKKRVSTIAISSVREFESDYFTPLKKTCDKLLIINNDTKLIEVVCVTQIMLNKERDEKYLEIRCLYSYTLQTAEFWPSAIELIKRFAKAENCKYVVAKSKNQRIFNIVNSVGFQETLRIFELSL